MALRSCKMTRQQETAGTKNRTAAENLQALTLLFPAESRRLQAICRGMVAPKRLNHGLRHGRA
jgi:hypothetical protein